MKTTHSSSRIGVRLASKLRGFCAATLVLAASITASHADEVHIGDTFEISVFGEEASWTSSVAADGTIRLSGIGAVEVAGLSFDDAEKAISEAVSEVEFFVAPRVSMALESRAPVFATGDVRQPGAFEYRPQLSVGIAVGLAGGPSVTGGEAADTPLAAAELAGQVELVEQEIARTLARIARVEAQLAGTQEADIDPSRMALLSGNDVVNAGQFLAIENAILRNERDATATMLEEWSREIAETEKQIELLTERVQVQNEVVELLQQELAAAASLRQRGLKTQSDLTRTERQAAETQARLLELEALLSQSRSRLAESRRGRARFNKDQMTDLLVQRREATGQLDALVQRRSTARAKQLALNDGPTPSAMEDMVRTVYTLRRYTKQGLQTMTVDRDHPLLPGDAVDVMIVPVEAEPMGVAPDAALSGETDDETVASDSGELPVALADDRTD